MKYKIEDMSQDDMLIIGAALDAMPHGKVQKLVARIQQQINQQEIAERDRSVAERNAAAEQWRETERERLRGELAKSKPTRSKKRN